MILRALSVRQPFAWAIANGLKPWENRPRRFNYRGPLLIHAGRALARADYATACALVERLSGRRPPAEPELGGIVGAVLLTACAEPLARDRQWRAAGHFGLRIESAVTLPFRAFRGALGLFKVKLTRREVDALRAAGLLGVRP